MTDFEDLLASIPTSEHLPSFREGSDLPPILHLSEPNDEFVPPTFREETALAPGVTSAILLTAPAAVGKTTVAAEIARRTLSPLFDLSRFQVGDGFIEGTLTRAYGPRSLADILGAIEAGNMALVFDALDEGEIRAGGNNFDAFMTDLCSLCQQIRGGPGIIVLARGETASLVELHFEEKNVSYASYIIDFFDRESAHKFLGLRLDAINARSASANRAAHRRYPDTFNEAVDVLFNSLSEALVQANNGHGWDNYNVKSFLGYAPVLTALAEVLRVGNYSVLTRDIKASPPWLTSGQSAWQVLTSIVQWLVEREQRKLVDNARVRMQAGADPLGFSDWDNLFTADEQIIRVLSRVLKVTMPDRLPVNLPGQLRDPYEDAIDLMLPQHPFLGDDGFASVVFQEYSYSKILQSGPSWLGTVVRQRLRESTQLPSPLLGYFMLAPDPDLEYPVIHAEDIGFFYNSLQSRSTQPGEIQLIIGENLVIGETDGSRLEGFVWQASGDGARFLVDDLEKGISFWRRVSYCFINSSQLVRLQSDGDFWLGPDCYIECDRLELSASEIRVDTGLLPHDESNEDGGGVSLIARSYTDSGVIPRLRQFGRGDLMISWPDVAYPWATYRATFETSNTDDDYYRVHEAYLHLRRILRGFRGSSAFRGTIGRSVQYINGVVVGQSALAYDLLQYLVETQLLRIQGNRYTLDTDKAGELGLSFNNLKTNIITKATREYLEQFLRTQGEK